MALEGVKNYMEDLVEVYLDQIMEEMACCKCKKCRKDVFAIALNHLRPMYVVTSKGQAMVKSNLLEGQFKADVVSALVAACQKVKSEMRHE
ncbi:MAG: late competence development ComFB family protein [Cellulosilyticaceae bacterium]